MDIETTGELKYKERIYFNITECSNFYFDYI